MSGDGTVASDFQRTPSLLHGDTLTISWGGFASKTERNLKGVFLSKPGGGQKAALKGVSLSELGGGQKAALFPQFLLGKAWERLVNRCPTKTYLCVNTYIHIRPGRGETVQRKAGLSKTWAVRPGQVKTRLPFAECWSLRSYVTDFSTFWRLCSFSTNIVQHKQKWSEFTRKSIQSWKPRVKNHGELSPASTTDIQQFFFLIFPESILFWRTVPSFHQISPWATDNVFWDEISVYDFFRWDFTTFNISE